MSTLKLREIADVSNLRDALKFVRQDKQDEYIHCPLRDIPYLWKIEARLPELSSRLLSGIYQPQKATILELIKSSFTTRPISHIYIEDWIVAQAILNKIGPLLDSRILSNSFAYRLNPNRNKSAKHSFFKAWYRDWPKFIQAIRNSIKSELPCILITDIAGYFENIDLNRMRQMIIESGVSQLVTDLLIVQLENWTWRHLYVSNRQMGLLQGNDTSSLYANFYLYDIDEYYWNKNIVYQRFMDDINIHAVNKNRAKIILGELVGLLRNKGLTVNTAKTYILEGNEIEKHFQFKAMDQIETLMKTIDKQGDSKYVKKRKTEIHNKLIDNAPLNLHLFKRLMTAYIRTRDGSIINRTLKYLVKYPDLTEKLCSYYLSLKNGNKVAKLLVTFLNDSEQNLFPSQEQLIIECLLYLNITVPDIWKEMTSTALNKISSPECNYYSKALYSLLVYKYGERRDLEKTTDIYLNGKIEEPILKKYLSLIPTRLANDDRYNRSIELLKKEANLELTELGIFLDETRKEKKIQDLIKFSNLKILHFGKYRFTTLDISYLILLNTLRRNKYRSNKNAIENHVNNYRVKIQCTRTKILLDELKQRL